ncbi:MAG: glycosyltransferase [Gammaproteobacteria bacterium]
MRILWIKTELLHPVDKGGRIRSYQMLRALAREHRVTYLALDDGSFPDAVELAREYAHRVVTVPFRSAAKMSPTFFLELLSNLFSPLPYAVGRYRSPQLCQKIRELAADADLLVCDFLAPSSNVPDSLPCRTVLFQHNVESAIWERHAAVPQLSLRGAYMRLQWRRMLRVEAAQCRRFDHVVAVSEQDVRLMRDQYLVRSISCIPTGVDIEYFAPAPTQQRSDSEIVFVGSMDWLPNDDGIRWFVEHIFDLVRSAVPNVRLTIVGRSPTAALMKLARRPGVEVTGTVPDVRPYLSRATVSIVPLRIGSGTRLKIYEAMAMGVPVVSSTIGAEGLPLTSGKHLLIADAPSDQAAAVISILRDRALAERLAANAQHFVRERGSWAAVAQRFLEECLGQKPLEGGESTAASELSSLRREY